MPSRGYEMAFQSYEMAFRGDQMAFHYQNKEV